MKTLMMRMVVVAFFVSMTLAVRALTFRKSEALENDG